MLTLSALAAALIASLYALKIGPFKDSDGNQSRKVAPLEADAASKDRRGFGRRSR